MRTRPQGAHRQAGGAPDRRTSQRAKRAPGRRGPGGGRRGTATNAGQAAPGPVRTRGGAETGGRAEGDRRRQETHEGPDVPGPSGDDRADRPPEPSRRAERLQRASPVTHARDPEPPTAGRGREGTGPEKAPPSSDSETLLGGATPLRRRAEPRRGVAKPIPVHERRPPPGPRRPGVFQFERTDQEPPPWGGGRYEARPSRPSRAPARARRR